MPRLLFVRVAQILVVERLGAREHQGPAGRVPQSIGTQLRYSPARISRDNSTQTDTSSSKTFADRPFILPRLLQPEGRNEQ